MLGKRTFHWTIIFAFLVLLLATPKPALAWSGCGSSYYVHRGDTLWSIANSYGTTVAAMRQANPNMGYWIYAGQTLCLPDGGNGYGNQGNGYGNQGNGYDYQSGGYGNQGNCYSNCYGNGYQGNGYQGSGYDNGYGNQGNCYSNCYGNGYQGSGYDNGYGNQGNCYSNCYGNSYGNGYDQGSMGYGHDNGYASYGAPSGGDGTYCIQRGDTLKMIAVRYGTTVGNLLALNPQIWNPNWIYAGQVIRLY